jgi:hypothetical protein
MIKKSYGGDLGPGVLAFRITVATDVYANLKHFVDAYKITKKSLASYTLQ